MEEQNLQAKSEVLGTPSLTISDTAIGYLNETGKWTKFLSIIGFVFTGLILIVALFSGSILPYMTQGQMTNMPTGMTFLFSGMYLLMGLVYFFPTWYLLKFSQKLKSALANQNNDELNEALSNQKSFYKFWGILFIITFGIYLIIGLLSLMMVFLT